MTQNKLTQSNDDKVNESYFVKPGLNINCDISRTVKGLGPKFCALSNLYKGFKCTKFEKNLRGSGVKCLKN